MRRARRIDVSKVIAGITCRDRSLFADDVERNTEVLREQIEDKSVLVVGGAGTIGLEFIKRLLPFRPGRLHVMDTNENGLTEVVRDLRSSFDMPIPEEFATYPMDFGSAVAMRMIEDNLPYDVVANFAALKHVRSEKDAYCAAYMIENNVLKNRRLLEVLADIPPRHLFCVSTDKAARPASLMGATKRLMEELLIAWSDRFPVTTARFANVAFSNGSLLDGFLRRLQKLQPLSSPVDVKRFFVSPEESGQLCLLACVLGQPGDIFVPKLSPDRDMRDFVSAGTMLLDQIGMKPLPCTTEEEAKRISRNLPEDEYPWYLFHSDTTGEKAYEEFYDEDEIVDDGRFAGISVVRYASAPGMDAICGVLDELDELIRSGRYVKSELVDVLERHIATFEHLEREKYLDQQM